MNQIKIACVLIFQTLLVWSCNANETKSSIEQKTTAIAEEKLEAEVIAEDQNLEQEQTSIEEVIEKPIETVVEEVEVESPKVEIPKKETEVPSLTVETPVSVEVEIEEELLADNTPVKEEIEEIREIVVEQPTKEELEVMNHNIWDGLLKKYVDGSGNVDYNGFKKEAAVLDQYLEVLNKADIESLNTNAAKALLINAYNAYTVKLIIDNYPLKSIMDIKEEGKSAWDIPFAKVGGKTYTLNAIEHEILRKKYNDPRIHVGVNCASFSCPKLINKALTESNINSTLESGMKQFINDTKRNKINTSGANLSKIFEWFKEDFTKSGSLVDYINKYSTNKISESTPVSYLEYNWSLNSK